MLVSLPIPSFTQSECLCDHVMSWFGHKSYLTTLLPPSFIFKQTQLTRVSWFTHMNKMTERWEWKWCIWVQKSSGVEPSKTWIFLPAASLTIFSSRNVIQLILGNSCSLLPNNEGSGVGVQALLLGLREVWKKHLFLLCALKNKHPCLPSQGRKNKMSFKE